MAANWPSWQLALCKIANSGSSASLMSLIIVQTPSTFPSIPFSRATATVATELNYGNGTTERNNEMAKRRKRTATAKWQRQHGNRMAAAIFGFGSVNRLVASVNRF